MMASNAYRKTWFQILHRPQPSNRAARIFNFFLAAVILANCLAVALETVPSIFAARKDLFFYLEAISIGVFVVEYCLRVWVCVEQQRYASPVLGRILFAIQPLPLLELRSSGRTSPLLTCASSEYSG
ncbi:MAG: ion transporter [Acidobacteriota bacterium]